MDANTGQDQKAIERLNNLRFQERQSINNLHRVVFVYIYAMMVRDCVF
jgi:hypothetical protein